MNCPVCNRPLIQGTLEDIFNCPEQMGLNPTHKYELHKDRIDSWTYKGHIIQRYLAPLPLMPVAYIHKESDFAMAFPLKEYDYFPSDDEIKIDIEKLLN